MRDVCAVTGANGFVGSRLAARLREEFEVLSVGRGAEVRWEFGMPVAEALRERGVSVLVHVAWDFANAKGSVIGSRRLFEDASAARVKRVVFVSTISAFPGARSEYGRAKLEVEEMVLAAGGTVVRPGLVWGDRPGGVMGAMREQVSRGGMVPVIGDGRYPQYLVHEDDLAAVVRVAAHGMFAGEVLTVAHPRAWMLKGLILQLAAQEGSKVRLVGVPWRLVYGVLWAAERMGVKVGFRSDSVLSLIYQNPAPVFSSQVAAREFGVNDRLWRSGMKAGVGNRQ